MQERLDEAGFKVIEVKPRTKIHHQIFVCQKRSFKDFHYHLTKVSPCR